MGDLYGAVIRLIIFLPLVGLLAYLSVKYGLGRRVPFQAAGHMRILERISLGPKAHLWVVQVNRHCFLIATGEKGATLIKELDGYPLPEPGELLPLMQRWGLKNRPPTWKSGASHQTSEGNDSCERQDWR